MKKRTFRVRLSEEQIAALASAAQLVLAGEWDEDSHTPGITPEDLDDAIDALYAATDPPKRGPRAR